MILNGTCPNWLCSDPARRISRIRAIAYLKGSLRATIHEYKYYGVRDWSMIFGRLLLAWLEKNAQDNPPDIIVANPTYLGPEGAMFAHTESVISAAAQEDVLNVWPFDLGEPRVLYKMRATNKSAATSAAQKRETARVLRRSLCASKKHIKGRHVLVYDDVCTTGSQMNAVAEYLIDDVGAKSVEGVVLARAPWNTSES